MHRFMQQALELAQRGIGRVSPNPLVGAVIVADGEVIGRGWHQQYGEAHAEVNAIADVADQGLLSGATMYVTLEPCSHWGKTPPCCDLIIRKGLAKVVVGCVDPYHEVCGGGIERMRAAGIDVRIGIMESECREMNRRFFTVQTHGRPYVILKWAQSIDGYIDIKRDTSLPPAWMTGDECRKLVHEWRAVEDAIMVGRRTVVMDNPSLTVRHAEGRNPLRVTMDRNLVLDSTYTIFDKEAQTLLLTDRVNLNRAIEKFGDIATLSINGLNYERPIIEQVLSTLTARRVQSLIVEGGTELLQSFIDTNLWDEARVFTSPHCISDLYPSVALPQGVAAPAIGATGCSINIIDGVELRTIKNVHSKSICHPPE